MPELAILVPTRGRPGNIAKVVAAWDFTNAWDHADLVLIVDADDPEIQGYRDVVNGFRIPGREGRIVVSMMEIPKWLPMVHKLDATARLLAQRQVDPSYWALGFAGDDHLPQTIGWAARYLAVLHELGTGMVYGDDGYQGSKLSTEWAVTADAVRALGRMVPAPVEHMYCDNSMMDVFGGAGAMRHLPEVRIEHMHPIAGKAENDEQYQRVNHRDQFRKDRMTYDGWRNGQLSADIATVRALRPNAADEPPVRPIRSTADQKITRTKDRMRSGPSAGRIRMNRFPFTREFKNVRGATPDEIGMALADFATQVPADQEIVELGVFQGRTALIMAWGASQGYGAHVTAIDPWDLAGNVYDPPFTDPESKAWAEYRIQETGYQDRIQLVQAFSHDVAADWSGKPVGLLFVDGDHTKEGARRDVEVWAAHLAPGATIAVDDYGHPDWPGVGQAMDELVDEGFLEPLEIFHDRLAVTRLKEAAGERSQDGPEPAAITSEGVSPSPYPAAPGQVAAEPDRAVLEAEWRRVDPEGVMALERSAAELDAEVSRREYVQPNELIEIEQGTPIDDLNLPNLKTLAKARGIVLGARKDKRSEILQALKDGR